MGRKNQINIKREIDPEKDKIKKDEIEDKLLREEEKIKNMAQEEIDNRFNDLWETRIKMIDYCDKNALPLCDYMTFDIFQNFVKHLVEE
jgi:hypothetical protein